ncbi:MAG: glycosyltransferase family 2 protein [Oscillospiraceae bacterium]|nr:glycosyltransferase family 2 protein [Oscillospiraceae bacterium]
MPKISIIIPVYNSEKYLNKCLDSVFSQSFKDFEIIIVNDGSPDNSQAIIDSYKAEYPGKICAFMQENAGQASARNRGLRSARGEFVMFLDSDDYLHPEAFEKAISCAEANSSDIVCFNMFFDTDGRIEEFNYRIFESDDPIKKYILNETSPCNKLIKRELLQNNALRFREGIIYEDHELIPRLALFTDKISFIDDRLYYYVIHSDSTMRRAKFSPKLKNIYIATDSLKNVFFETEFHQELECIFIEHLLHGAGPRCLEYPEGRSEVSNIRSIMKTTFPKWYKNKYYKGMRFAYKLACTLVYMKIVPVFKLLAKIKNSV